MDTTQKIKTTLINFINSGDFQTVLNGIELRGEKEISLGDILEVSVWQGAKNNFRFKLQTNSKNGFSELTKTITL